MKQEVGRRLASVLLTLALAMVAVGLLLVPLEGIGPGGMRLGKGGGYYDCLLSKGNPVTLGCVLSWQWADWIPCEPWDKPLHACADRHGVHMFDLSIHSKEGKR